MYQLLAAEVTKFANAHFLYYLKSQTATASWGGGTHNHAFTDHKWTLSGKLNKPEAHTTYTYHCKSKGVPLQEA